MIAESGKSFSGRPERAGRLWRRSSGAAHPRLVAMLAPHPADGAGAGAHDDALGGDAILAALDPLEQRPVGHSRRREDHVASGELVQIVNAVQILDAPFGGAGPLDVVAEQQAALEL